MTKRFALYVRVSTDDQLQGASLEVQEEAGRKYVASLGGEVVRLYKGEPESGTKPLDQRPKLEAALAGAQLGEFAALWVLDQERLARSAATVETVYATLLAAKAELHVGSKLEVMSNPETEFMAGIFALSGRLSARKSRERTRMSRERLLGKGANAFGRPLFGRKWNKRDEKWEIDLEKQKKIQDALAHYLGGKSLLRAAEAVRMAHSALQTAFKSMHITEWKRTINTPEGLREFVITVPAIATPEQFEAYRSKANANNTIRLDGLKPGRHRWLLQGLIRCSKCGGNMSGQPRPSGRPAYYRHLPATYNQDKGCTFSIAADLIETDVLYACSAVLQSGDKLKEAIEAAMRGANAQALDAEAALASAIEHEKTCGRRQENFLEKLTEIEGPMTDALKQKMKTLNLALDNATADRAKLEQQCAALKVPAGVADEAMKRIKHLIGYQGVGPLTNLSPEQQRMLVAAVVGRASRTAPEGIYIKMVRGRSRKGNTWWWELRGSLATVRGTSSPWPELAGYPDVRMNPAPSPSAIKLLAQLAEQLPAQIQEGYGMHRTAECSSGDSRPSA